MVGGLTLPREGTGTTFTTDSNGKPVSVVNNLSPLRSNATDGGLLLFNTSGAPTTVQDLGSYNVQSREVMRVRIPSGNLVHPATRGDGSQVVELYVSTPNGISNRLQIPLDPAKTRLTPPPTSSTTARYSLADPNLKIQVKARRNDDGTIATVGPIPFPPVTSIRLVPMGSDRPDKVAVRFAIPISTTGVASPLEISDVEPDPSSGVITLDSSQLDLLAKKFLATLAGTDLTSKTTYTTSKIEVVPLPDTGASFTTTSPLTVTLEFVIPAASATPAANAAPKVASGKPATVAGTLTSAPAGRPRAEGGYQRLDAGPASYTRSASLSSASEGGNLQHISNGTDPECAAQRRRPTSPRSCLDCSASSTGVVPSSGRRRTDRQSRLQAR